MESSGTLDFLEEGKDDLDFLDEDVEYELEGEGALELAEDGEGFQGYRKVKRRYGAVYLAEKTLGNPEVYNDKGELTEFRPIPLEPIAHKVVEVKQSLIDACAKLRNTAVEKQQAEAEDFRAEVKRLYNQAKEDRRKKEADDLIAKNTRLAAENRKLAKLRRGQI